MCLPIWEVIKTLCLAMEQEWNDDVKTKSLQVNP